jgi:acyl-coenzyme A synthetase/AMP-(fatty) acid ligase
VVAIFVASTADFIITMIAGVEMGAIFVPVCCNWQV